MRSFLIITAAVAATVGLSCSGSKPDTSPVLRTVRGEQVYASGGERTRTFSGVARSGTESRLSFRVGGTVERILVTVGDEVSKGQLIAEIDAEDYQLRLQDAEAALVQAKAQERNASTEYDRVRGLYENRNASRQDLDAARTGYESAEANVSSIENRLELARRQLGYARLVAPINGSIAARSVEVNENVQPGQVVCLITSGSDIEVEVAIPEILISQIAEGNAVEARFDALPDRVYEAVVTEVGVASTGTATTFPVKVRLNDAGKEIRSGMAAEVSFPFGRADSRERYLVRAVAVGEDRNGRFVFVVAPSGESGVGVVSRKPVTIGDLQGERIAVTSGLNDGDRVVTAGVSKLTDGQRVRFDFQED